ncbi:MAG: hypothetical protein JSU95_06125 [Betaproteobacteria bacterium]|nr:MAG: hypothetical protein JSU95_06125 [Betaproteobacteria bacterium]
MMKMKNSLRSAQAGPINIATRNWLGARRSALVATLSATALTGCYVMPVGHDAEGKTVYAYSPLAPEQVQGTATPAGAAPAGPAPRALSVKLYPINDLANQTGVLTGQVTNMMTGKGRFTFNYQGETLVGEATRVANDQRRGVASAYGPGGMFARCEYQMSSPTLGAGTCTFSNNAMYQVHIGN